MNRTNVIQTALSGNYLILIRNPSIFLYILTRVNRLFTRSGYRWSHTLVSFKGSLAKLPSRLAESIPFAGVHYADPQKAFRTAQRVALMLPAHLSCEEWLACLKVVDHYVGTPYSWSFNFFSKRRMSCTEFVMALVFSVENPADKFPDLYHLLRTKRKITPAMLYASPDFFTARIFDEHD